jgi:sigma-B regulation protein RsbU (phosphoserine phosphatase)
MYRILLLTENAAVESRLDALLCERLSGQYLLKVLSGPSDAISLVNGRAPDVVIVAMPERGEKYEACIDAARAFAGGLPVLAAIAVEDEALEVRALQCGAHDCLVLPELTSRALVRVIRNAVERSKVEAKLAREEEMLGNLLAKLPDRIYFKDLDSRFVRINNAQATLFGLRDPSEAIGRTDHDFFTAEHAQPALEDERRIIRSGDPMLDKLEKETLPDGSVGWVLTSKLPLRNKAGEIIGTFGISHDVTEMKVLEETIEAERSRLEELSEDLRAKNLQLEQDLVMAKGIQEALLPGRRYVFPGNANGSGARVECASVYRPAEAVGGDFFTMIPLSENRMGVFICDIMGHGLRAALGTAIVRGLLEELKSRADQPDRFLTELNRSLRAILRNIDEPLLVTACYLVMSVDSEEVLLSSAGHPLPMKIQRATGAVSPLGTRRSAHGPALALFDDATYGMERFQMTMDDLVLLFTDGATEMSDLEGREIGIDRFMAAAGKYANLDAQHMCERVLDEIQLAAGGANFQDDVCLLAIERRMGGHDRQPGSDILLGSRQVLA